MADQTGYTRVPNALLELLPTLPDAECRVVLAIIRKTTGWQKVCDVISYSQLQAATRMSKQGVINGVEGAIKRGIIKRTPSGFNNGFCYELCDPSEVVNEVDHLKQSTTLTGQRSRPLVVNEVDHLGASSGQRSRHTKEKILKKEKESAAREKRAPPSAHQQLMTLYQEALGYKIPRGAKEAAAAKRILDAGYTPAQAIEVYHTLKARGFYSEKHLSLHTVYEQLGAVLNGKNGVHRNGTRSLRPPLRSDPEWPGTTEAGPDELPY